MASQIILFSYTSLLVDLLNLVGLWVSSTVGLVKSSCGCKVGRCARYKEACNRLCKVYGDETVKQAVQVIRRRATGCARYMEMKL